MPRSLMSVAVFMVSFLALAMPYWQIPYSQIALPNSLLGPGALITCALAMFLRLEPRRKFAEVILACGGAFPAVVLSRIIYDVAFDASSHNLWPFEIVIAILLGLIVSAAGAAVGSLLFSSMVRSGDDADET